MKTKIGKTAMDSLIRFLEKCKEEKREFDYDMLIVFATELRDTTERYELLKAYMGNYDPKISDEAFRALYDEAKHYYESRHGKNAPDPNL